MEVLIDAQDSRRCRHGAKITASPHRPFHRGSITSDKQATVTERDDAIHISEVLIEHELRHRVKILVTCCAGPALTDVWEA